MSRRTSKRRTSHRKVKANRYVLVNRTRGALRRLTRNMSVGGVDVVEKVLFPALGATGGMMLARWVGSKAGPALLPGQDPKLVATGASVASAFAAYLVGERLGASPEMQAAVAAGAGVMGLTPWLPSQFMQDLSPALTPPAVSGFYQRSMLGGLMVDTSHAGSPYKGMLGMGGDGDIDDAMSQAEAITGVSTVEPIDAARQAITVEEFPVVTERMGSPGDRGYAGGIYARNIFSGELS